MKFVKVTNPIITITTKEVTFKIKGAEITIRRYDHRRIQWAIREDGIYVRTDLVEIFDLKTEA